MAQEPALARVRTWLGPQVSTALEVPRWALRFYLRHILLIVGISLLPAIQRAVWALWGARMTPAANLLLDGVTLVTRLVLVVLVARLVFAAPAHGAPAPGTRRGVRAFLKSRWPSLILQFVFLGALAGVFDFIPEQVVAPRIPLALQSGYWAGLLAFKNVTVIAYTIVWLIAAIRQIMTFPQPLPGLGPKPR